MFSRSARHTERAIGRPSSETGPAQLQLYNGTRGLTAGKGLGKISRSNGPPVRRIFFPLKTPSSTIPRRSQARSLQINSRHQRRLTLDCVTVPRALNHSFCAPPLRFPLADGSSFLLRVSVFRQGVEQHRKAKSSVTDAIERHSRISRFERPDRQRFWMESNFGLSTYAARRDVDHLNE